MLKENRGYKVKGISKMLIIAICLLSIEAQGGTSAERISIVTDITLSCYMTALKLKDVNGKISYRVISSSPRDCGVIDPKTGRLNEFKTRIYCPRGYEQDGFVRGGVVGAFDDNVFYKAEGICLADYFLSEY